MRPLTFTWYQKNNILYTSIEGVIAILKIEFTLPKTRNDKIRLTDEVIILYKSQWEPPMIENYQLKIPDSYTFIASNLLFEALGITNNIKLSAVKSSLFKEPIKPL